MRIPATFCVYGQVYHVDFVSNLGRCEGALGRSHHQHNIIELQDDVEGWPVVQEQLEQTFIHELVHVILHYMNQEELTQDEKFVDLFASLLHQTITTMTFHEDGSIFDTGEDAGHDAS